MLKIIEKKLRKDLPEIKPGLIVRVHQAYKDKNKERISIFEGIIISVKNRNSINKTFTVRGKAAGQYLEKTYFYHSPTIKKIEVLGESKARRAKLYFVREISEHKIKKKLKPVYKK
jgi:large subunit ribosomal protein L19